MHKGGFGFRIELLIQFSPPPNPSAIGKMMPPPLIASFASSIGQLKREEAGNPSRCVTSNISPRIGVVMMVALPGIFV